MNARAVKAGPPPETIETAAGRRVLIVYNPVAGRRRRARFETALARLRALGCAVTLRETAGPGDATDLAHAAVTGAAVKGAAVTGAAGRDEADVLVAAGGDGTINEAVNGLLAGPRSRSSLDRYRHSKSRERDNARNRASATMIVDAKSLTLTLRPKGASAISMPKAQKISEK